MRPEHNSSNSILRAPDSELRPGNGENSSKPDDICRYRNAADSQNEDNRKVEAAGEVHLHAESYRDDHDCRSC